MICLATLQSVGAQGLLNFLRISWNSDERPEHSTQSGGRNFTAIHSLSIDPRSRVGRPAFRIQLLHPRLLFAASPNPPPLSPALYSTIIIVVRRDNLGPSRDRILGILVSPQNSIPMPSDQSSSLGDRLLNTQ